MLKVVIIYDISDDKSRYKLAKNLLRYGIRTQQSVFEADINKNELKEIEKLVKRFSNEIDCVDVYQINDYIQRVGNVEYLEIDDFIF